MSRQCMLSTIDNPYNPFTNFDDWYRFDKELDHNSCELLALRTYDSEQFTEDETNEEIERAIDEIVLRDPLNIFKKVIKDN